MFGRVSELENAENLRARRPVSEPRGRFQSSVNGFRFLDRGCELTAFHVRVVSVGGRACHIYRGAGNGGQLVVVISELDLVALFMSASYRPVPVWWPWSYGFVPRVLIPATTTALPN